MTTTPAPLWTLHHGNSLDILRTLDSDSVDALITDPPYSSGGRTTSERQRPTGTKYVQSGQQPIHADFAGDGRDQRSFLTWCSLWLAEAHRIARPGAVALVFCDWRQLPTMTDAIQAGGWLWRGIVVWDKTGKARPYSARGGFRAQCEYAVWATKGSLAKTVNLPGVFTHPVRRDDKHHQAGKPTPLMRDLVRIVPEGGTVLDPFAGSATTGVACTLENRRFIGIELDPGYHHLAHQRLQETTSP